MMRTRLNAATFNDELFETSTARVQQASANGGPSYAGFVKAYIQSSAGLYP